MEGLVSRTAVVFSVSHSPRLIVPDRAVASATGQPHLKYSGLGAGPPLPPSACALHWTRAGLTPRLSASTLKLAPRLSAIASPDESSTRAGSVHRAFCSPL